MVIKRNNKTFCFLLQDIKDGETVVKVYEEICDILKKTVCFCKGELLKRTVKVQGQYQDFLLYLSLMEKKYYDKDFIANL